MEISHIPFLSTTELSQLIKTKNISPVEATQAYLERISQVDSSLNSYITVCGEQALSEAQQAESDIANGKYLGPMHGIPVAVKDQFWTKGIQTTNGSTIHKGWIPGEDATVISNLKSNGAILLGKLNMSEYASGDAFHHPYGRPKNPWDLSRNPGTSSSGSGAATAACLCSTSLGEDTGGSIRGPASFCGLVGIRPSWGRVSRYGVFPASWSMDTVGPISRTTEDCAMTLKAIAGYDPKDPYTWNQPVPDYASELTGDIRGTKIGVITERVDTDANDSEVKDLVKTAISALGNAGAILSEISIPLIAHSAAISSTIISCDAAALTRRDLEQNLDQLDHNNQVRLLMGSIMPADAYLKAMKLRELLRSQILEALTKVDVLVMPTSSIPAPKIPDKAGVTSKEEVLEGFKGRRSFTSPFNLANTPALSICCGFTSDILPVGLQIVGKPFAESTIFKVAYGYQSITDWHTQRPSV